jgi:hypothetical protein
MYTNPFKIGDIVQCINRNYVIGNHPDRTYPQLNHIYMVRDVVEDCVRVEEIINPLDKNKLIEPMWYTWHFIKLSDLVEDLIIRELIETLALETVPLILPQLSAIN